MKNNIRKNNGQPQLLAARLSSGRLNEGNLLLVAVFCLFLVVSCKLIGRNSAPADNSGNSNISNANEAKSSSYDREKFQKLLDASDRNRKNEFACQTRPEADAQG